MRYQLLVILAGAAVTLTACTGGAPAKTGTAAPTPDESTIPQTGPAPTKPGASPQAGCPVDAATLEKAFAANTPLAGNIVLGKGLKNITCVQDYATALTQPDNVEAATVLFNYDGAKKMWIALAGGTSNVCANVVPDAIKKQLPNCA